MSSYSIERRKNSRIKFEAEVSTKGRKSGYFESYDLSPFGIFIKTSDTLPVNSKLFVNFNLPDSRIPVKTVCRVVRHFQYSEDSNIPQGIGLEFISIKEFDRKRIGRFCSQFILDQDDYLNSDNYTLIDFLKSPERDFFERTKPTYAYVNDIIKKGYYTYRRPIASPLSNIVKVYDERINDYREMIMMGSNDYLGLASHPFVLRKLHEAIEKYGAGVASAPMLSGTFEVHKKLESKLAKMKDSEDAILFPTGYSTNIGCLSTLTTEGDLILIDRLAHASLVDGCMMSNASFKTFKHSNIENLNDILEKEKNNYKAVMIVVEGIYSMDGDIAPLPELVEVAERYGARLLVDDAHATGVIGKSGKGTSSHFDLSGKVDINVGTLSKAIGQLGGFVASKKEVVNYLRTFARSYFFSTSLPITIVSSALAALEVIENEPEIMTKLWDNIEYFKNNLLQSGFNVKTNSQSPIIPIIVGEELILRKLSKRIHEEGIYLSPVPYPAVSRSQTRLRLAVMANHTKDDLDKTLEILKKVGNEFGIINNKKLSRFN